MDLWDEDGILEFPFAPHGWPARLEGRQAIADYMRHYPDHVDVHDFPDVRIHQTTAPETVVVEMRGIGRLVETDSPFDMTYIAAVTVKDGRITSATTGTRSPCRSPAPARTPSTSSRQEPRTPT